MAKMMSSELTRQSYTKGEIQLLCDARDHEAVVGKADIVDTLSGEGLIEPTSNSKRFKLTYLGRLALLVNRDKIPDDRKVKGQNR